jgi:hypothetical protein
VIALVHLLALRRRREIVLLRLQPLALELPAKLRDRYLLLRVLEMAAREPVLLHENSIQLVLQQLRLLRVLSL